MIGFTTAPLIHLIKNWLVGHEIHPYTSPSKIIQYTEAQNTALSAFKQSLKEGAKSFLHIAPTSTGKTPCHGQSLKGKASKPSDPVKFLL